MDTIKELRELQNKGVEDIDAEVYYREVLGCKVRLEGSTCAAIDCGQGDVKVCERPESTARRMAATAGPSDPGC
jgi:hypothetical protein